MLNRFELNIIAEIRARVANKQQVATWEKQMILNLLKRQGSTLPKSVVEQAQLRGFDTTGIKTL